MKNTSLGFILLCCISTIAVSQESTLSYGGDVRFRYDIDQHTQNNETESRDRQRIRARTFLKYQAENISAGIRLATASTSKQSPHHTLGTEDAADNASFGLDRAYLTIHAFEGSLLTLGKAGGNWWQQNEVFLDDDLSPEGVQYSHKISDFQANVAYFVVSEKNWDGIGKDNFASWGQLVYQGKFSNIKPTITGGAAHISWDETNNGITSSFDRTIFSIAAQVKISDHAFGFDYLKSDADTDNTGIIFMLKSRIKIISMGIWYYDVGQSATLGNQYSQDNFPNSTGFNGFRFQLGTKILDQISTDLRYYYQTMDSDASLFSRIQLNFNVKI